MSNLTAFDFGMRLGCKVVFKDTGDIGTIFSVNVFVLMCICPNRILRTTDAILVLRRLESITEDEVRELYKEVEGSKWIERPDWLHDDQPPHLWPKIRGFLDWTMSTCLRSRSV